MTRWPQFNGLLNQQEWYDCDIAKKLEASR